MRRKLLNVATVLSLLLLCAVTVLWVRSYWVADAAIHWSPVGVPISHRFWSTNGYLGLVRLDPPAGSSEPPPMRGWFFWSGPAGANQASQFASRFPRDSYRLFGVMYRDVIYPGPFPPMRERALMIPYWLLLAALGALPLARLLSRARRRRAARAAAGLCLICGYDLRATPGRCPKCGWIPERTMALAATLVAAVIARLTSSAGATMTGSPEERPQLAPLEYESPRPSAESDLSRVAGCAGGVTALLAVIFLPTGVLGGALVVRARGNVGTYELLIVGVITCVGIIAALFSVRWLRTWFRSSRRADDR
jgi:hypothetical protein